MPDHAAEEAAALTFRLNDTEAVFDIAAATRDVQARRIAARDLRIGELEWLFAAERAAHEDTSREVERLGRELDQQAARIRDLTKQRDRIGRELDDAIDTVRRVIADELDARGLPRDDTPLQAADHTPTIRIDERNSTPLPFPEHTETAQEWGEIPDPVVFWSRPE